MIPTVQNPSESAELVRAYDLLAQTRAESVWLANFTSANTRTTYRRAIADFIVDLDVESPDALYGVSQAHVIAWRDLLQSRGHTNATIRARLSALSSLFGFLTDKQLCAHNPVSGVLRPKVANAGLGSGKTPSLTRRQVRAMLEAPLNKAGEREISQLQKLRDRALLHVYFFTGGRCSEPGTLRVKDFRQDRGYWVLEFTIKGGKSNIVAIAEVDDPNAECAQAILEYLEHSGHGFEDTKPLFLAVKHGQNTGEALTRRAFYHLFKKYVALAGLPRNITPHSARSTFITQAYEAGLQGEDIQRTVGHSSITTTEGYNQSARKMNKSASLGVQF